MTKRSCLGKHICAIRRFALLGVLVSTIGGCSFGSYSSEFMRPTEDRMALKPAPGQSLVVFVRPSGYAPMNGATLFDGDGRFLGQIPAQSHFAVNVPAGKRQLFWIWAENVDGIQVEPVAGKTYFVEVSSTLGWASARMHLYAIKPSSESWSKQTGWIADTKQLVPDMERGMSYYRANRWADVQKKLSKVQRDMAGYEGKELDRRTLTSNDGI